MPAPSIEVTIGDRGPSSQAPGDIGAFFAIGLTKRGPVGVAKECLSLASVKSIYGDVQTYSHLIRSAEAYFREGGSRMVISRAVGPGATTGLLALSNTVPAVVLTVNASSPGDWSTDLTITVTAGTGNVRNVTLKDAGATVLTGAYSDTASLQTALALTGLVTSVQGAGTWPIAVIAETALSAGNAQTATITQTEYDTALAVFDVEQGVGSVGAPGITTAAMHSALVTHGHGQKRFALLDAIDTATVASLTAPAAVLRALGVKAGYGQMFNWVKVPVVGSSSVTIPPSGAVAGLMARADRENAAGPGQPAAGRFGTFRWVQDITQTWSIGDRNILSDAGFTVIRNISGAIQPYDGVTLADPVAWPQYAEASGVRVVLAVYGESRVAISKYALAVIDGNRHLLSAIEKDLVGICQSWYLRGALFGSVAGEAFNVDATGLGVNPVAQLALRKVAAQIELRTSPYAGTISLLITKVASSDTI